MADGTPKFGAALGTDTYTTKVEVEKKTNIATWVDKTGTTKKVLDYDPTTDFSVDIEADAAASYTPGVITTLPLTGITGGVTVCPSVKYSETNDGKAVTSVSGTNYPSASKLT